MRLVLLRLQGMVRLCRLCHFPLQPRALLGRGGRGHSPYAGHITLPELDPLQPPPAGTGAGWVRRSFQCVPPRAAVVAGTPVKKKGKHHPSSGACIQITCPKQDAFTRECSSQILVALSFNVVVTHILHWWASVSPALCAWQQRCEQWVPVMSTRSVQRVHTAPKSRLCKWPAGPNPYPWPCADACKAQAPTAP